MPDLLRTIGFHRDALGLACSGGIEEGGRVVWVYGTRECYVKDPDGRQLTLTEPSDPDDPVTITSL